MDLYTTIQHGVTGTAMIAWSESMPSRELAAVAAFIGTLRGHPVPEGKAPQGTKVSALP
jgi:mono/diheme cytochrome c family protein